MSRILTVGVVQMRPSLDPMQNIQYLDRALKRLDHRITHRPALVVGVEFGISPISTLPIPGKVTGLLGEAAHRHGIYFIPGSLKEAIDSESGFFNTAPVFAPSGDLIALCRKVVPWTGSLEAGTVPGSEPHVFEVPELSTKIGVCICYDGDFPEITRTLLLKGAEVIVQPSMDADYLPKAWYFIRQARALENQVFFVYTNGVGKIGSQRLKGWSRVIAPDGTILRSAGRQPTTFVCELDLEDVTNARRDGTWGLVTPVRDLVDRRLSQPFASEIDQSPLAKTLQRPP